MVLIPHLVPLVAGNTRDCILYFTTTSSKFKDTARSERPNEKLVRNWSQLSQAWQLVDRGPSGFTLM